MNIEKPEVLKYEVSFVQYCLLVISILENGLIPIPYVRLAEEYRVHVGSFRLHDLSQRLLHISNTNFSLIETVPHFGTTK